MTLKMNALRFVEIMQAYGSDSARWPESERAAALAFAKTHEPAAQILAQSRQLDDLLSTQTAPAPSDLLKSRILKQATPIQPAAKARPAFYRIAAVLLFAGIAGIFAAGQMGGDDFTEEEINLLVETEEAAEVEYADASEFIDAQLDDLWADIL